MHDRPDDDDRPDWETQIERSKSGHPVWRHEAGTRDFEPAVGDGSLIGAVDDHLERHLGPAHHVFHEIVSDLVHVDVHIVAPTDDRPFYTLVTSGMAERPMSQPPGVTGCQFAELYLCLPPTWPGLDAGGLSPGDPLHPFQDPRHYWPIRMLKYLARFPHEYDTWLWYGHTVPNGEPPEPFAPDTALCSAVLLPGVTVPKDFHVLKVGDRDVNFFSVVPLYAEEQRLKLDKGVEGLFPLFDKHGVSEVLDPQRPNVAAAGRGKRWWPFGRG